MADVARLLEQVVEQSRAPVLVVDAPDVHRPEGQVRTVVAVADDWVALRALVTALERRRTDLGHAREVAVVVGEHDRAVTVRPHPMWPAVTDVDARTVDGGATTRVELARRAPALPVLRALAGLPGTPGEAGLRVGAVHDPADEVPLDVLLGGDVEPAPGEVTGRAPLRVEPDEEPLDEGAWTPSGFRRDWTRGPVVLDRPLRLTDLPHLRDAQAVSTGDPRDAARLALAGVPATPYDDPGEREAAARVAWRAAVRAHGTLGWRERLAGRAGVRFDEAAYDDLEHRLWERS